MALKTHFGRVLSGAVNSKEQHCPETCCLVTTSTSSGAGQESQLEQSSVPFRKGTTIVKSRLAFGCWYICAATRVFNNSWSSGLRRSYMYALSRERETDN